MRKIDYESPTHQIDEVMFDVKLQDVYSMFQPKGELFGEEISSPNYKAVVNQQNGRILSVVGKNYELVSNAKALGMGKEIFQGLYPTVDKDELIPYKVVAPTSCASAHIDLIHKTVNFDVWEQETWLPFLRVTNSYNRTYALSFEIGFVRKLCSNGVIFNKDTMKLKYVHNSGRIKNYTEDAKLIQAKTLLFKNQCNRIKNYQVPPKHMFPLVCKILNVKLDISNDKNAKKRIDQLYKLYQCYSSMSKEYMDELGANGYTAFNIATDLISHQDTYKNLNGYYLSVRSYYSRPSIWMEDFIEKVIKNNINHSTYLKGITNGLDAISKITGINWYTN